MLQPIGCVGLDVSKERIAVAVAEPDGLVVEQEVDTWIQAVSLALEPWSGLQAQFDEVSDENPAVAALLKSNALSIRFANHKTTLDALIKYLSQVADLDAQGASS
jgi:hypothetical protein